MLLNQHRGTRTIEAVRGCSKPPGVPSKQFRLCINPGRLPCLRDRAWPGHAGTFSYSFRFEFPDRLFRLVITVTPGSEPPSRGRRPKDTPQTRTPTRPRSGMRSAAHCPLPQSEGAKLFEVICAGSATADSGMHCAIFTLRVYKDDGQSQQFAAVLNSLWCPLSDFDFVSTSGRLSAPSRVRLASAL
jgi:hypothetical protein